MGLAFWIASLVRIPRGWPMWTYVVLNAVAVGFVERKFEKRIIRGLQRDGRQLRLKVTPKRLLALALFAALWCLEYVAILLYAPHLIVRSHAIVTISLFWILPLIVATILEMYWMKQDAR